MGIGWTSYLRPLPLIIRKTLSTFLCTRSGVVRLRFKRTAHWRTSFGFGEQFKVSRHFFRMLHIFLTFSLSSEQVRVGDVGRCGLGVPGGGTRTPDGDPGGADKDDAAKLGGGVGDLLLC